MPKKRRILQSSLEGIFEFANEAIVTVDSNRLIALFNPAAERIFGYTEEDVLGRSLEILIPLSLRPLHEHHMRKFVASSEVGREMGHRGEILGRRQDGSTFPAEASIFRSTLPGGGLSLTAILQDLSQREQQEALENSLRLSRTIQLHFFPESLPQLPGVDLAAVNIPSDVISRDYYDFFKIVEGHWGLVIGKKEQLGC